MTDATDTLYQGDPLREAVKFLLDNMRCDDPLFHQMRGRLRQRLDETEDKSLREAMLNARNRGDAA